MSVVFVYPDQQIPRYFEQSPLTQDECNKLILDLFVKEFRSNCDPELSDGEVKSTIHLDHGKGSFQGCFSYTVVIRSADIQMVVQFRNHCDRVDPLLWEGASACYGDWVPKTKFYDDAAGQLTISPYAGVSYARQSHEYSFEQRINSINDFARFIAFGCFNARESSLLEVQKIQQRLSIWATWTLNESISAVIQDASAHSAELLQLPLVYSHGDLNGLNILTDAEGHITGIIDWGESAWKPFGVGLYGLDTFLGNMGSEGFSIVLGYERLRAQFFKTLWANMPLEMVSRRGELENVIRLAEIVGVLYRHLEWVADGDAISQTDLQYLESCLEV